MVTRPETAPRETSFDFVFDSNAVRSLGLLSATEWSRFLAGWRARALTTAWVPRVISEVAGTNLDQKAGVPQDTLETLVSAIWRFDEMSHGKVLPDENEVIRDALYVLAGAYPPLPDRAVVAGWRSVLDHARGLSSARLIAIEDDEGTRKVVLKDQVDPHQGMAVVMPRSFRAEVGPNIDYWRHRTRCQAKSTDKERFREIVAFFPSYVRAAAASNGIAVPPDVVEEVLKAPAERIFRSSIGYRFGVEMWYMHVRATGNKTSISDNDMADIAISSYLSYGDRLVTDDRKFCALLGAVLADPSRVISFAAVQQEVMLGVSS